MTDNKQHIIYVGNKAIDKQKWDTCIEGSPEGSIYVLSFYLDIMSKHWDALILNDYEMVMPLVWNKKYGFYYLYQPYFLQHVGIFGRDITVDIINTFLSSIPKKFKYWDIDFKEKSIDPHEFVIPNLHLKKRKNFFLSLEKSHDNLKNGYKRLARRMLRKATEKSIEVIRNCDPEEVILFYKNNYSHKQKHIAEEDYKKITAVTTMAFKSGRAATYLAKTPAGEIVAAYVVLKDKRYVYSLIGGSNETGKEQGAFYLLTDTAIKDHAGSGLIFRFEGSDKEGIALFNAQFNPFPIEYYHLKLNNLPWPIKLFKK